MSSQSASTKKAKTVPDLSSTKIANLTPAELGSSLDKKKIVVDDKALNP